MDTLKVNHKRTVAGSNGFTVIELMIAMAVMAFGILGYSFLQSRSLQNRVFAREMNRATTVAQEVMEELMALPYNHALLADENTDGTPTNYPANGSGVTRDGKQWFVRTDGNFRYYTRWEVTAGIPTTGIKLIELFTAWEKKTPDGTITLGGYNSSNPLPTFRSFMRNHG